MTLFIQSTTVRSYVVYNCDNVFHTVPTSNTPVRLVPPEAGLNFLGRVEVFHNDEWGTVCDNNFGLNEAHVICKMANFSLAACFVPRARFGAGSGMYIYNYYS